MKKLKNFIIDLKNYKDNLHNLTTILLTLLTTGAFLFIALFLVTDRHINELGNARVSNLQAEVSTLFDDLNRLVLSLSQGSHIQSPSDIFDPTFMSIDTFQKELPVECIDQIMVYDKNRRIIKTCRGAYTYRFLGKVLESAGETVDGFEVALADSDSPSWITGQKKDAQVYCLAPISPETLHDSMYLILTLKLPTLEDYLDHFDDQSYNFVTINNFCLSNTGSGRLETDTLEEPFIRTLTGTGVRCFTRSDSLLAYTVAIPLKSFYVAEFIVFICFIGYAVLLLLWEFRKFILFRKQNEAKINVTLQSLSENLGENTEKDNPEIIATIYDEIYRYKDQTELSYLNDRSHNIRHILFGHYQGTPSEERLHDSGIDGSCNNYFVATFFIDDYADMFFDERDPSENVQAAHMMLQSTLVSLVHKQDTVTSCSVSGNFSAIFCIKDDKKAEENVIRILQKTIDLIEHNYGLTICTVLSNSVSTPGDLSIAYQETVRIWSFAKSIGSDSDFIICREQHFSDGLITEDDFLKQIRIITNTILLQNYELIPDMVDTLIRQNILSLTDNMELAQSRLLSLTNLLAEAVIKCNIPNAESSEFANRIISSDSVSQLYENMKTVFEEINKYDKENSPKDMISIACDCIQKNVSNPNLSVIMICDTLEISKQYLSRMFKLKLNKTVSAYINEYRVNYSKHLLATTNMNVADIAVAVGYTIPDTYTRNFKKLENITPTEYRQFL